MQELELTAIEIATRRARCFFANRRNWTDTHEIARGALTGHVVLSGRIRRVCGDCLVEIDMFRRKDAFLRFA